MTKSTLFISIIFINYISISSAANILALFTTGSPSHHIWNSPLVIALANRGHNVTVLSPEAQKEPVANLTDLTMTDLYKELLDKFNWEESSEISELDWIKAAFVFFGEGCEHTLKTDAFKQLMNYPSDTVFDLIIIEAFGVECLLGVIPKFGNPPVVAINGFGVANWVFEITGTPNNPSYIPQSTLTLSDHMTFIERAKNFITLLYSNYLYHYDYLPSMDKVAATYFGSHIPPSQEMLKRISVVLSNFHPVFNYPWPTTPNLIPVAGIQIKEPKPLPKDLQTFLDEAKDGAIFFSLGTNVRSDKLSQEKKKALLDAFAELPQRILWKFESDLSGVPKNVKIAQWLPQSDILAHPNIKLFLTHSGMLSTHEAIHRGVPVVGIPFLADQFINIRKLVNHGCGLALYYKDLTKETALATIRTVIRDPSYRENMKALSARFRDDPQTPLERAVYWTEYVLRHKNAAHLQSAAKDLNLIQYLLLDVIALLLTIPILLITLLYCACCRRKSKQSKKQKKN